jgi:hypothetical protein
VADNSEDWTVWGNSKEPILIGTEQDTKGYIKKAFAETDLPYLDLYLAAPDGTEWDYNQYEDTWSKI